MATLAPAAAPTEAAPAAVSADVVAGPAAGTVRVMALGLWGVVGSLLGYGIVMTVIKASALFA